MVIRSGSLSPDNALVAKWLEPIRCFKQVPLSDGAVHAASVSTQACWIHVDCRFTGLTLSFMVLLLYNHHSSIAFVKIQQLVTYKYLHKVRSAVLASASKHKIPKTRKPRQTWKRLFSQPTRKVRMLCNLLLRRKLCTTAGFLRSETCIHAINSPTQPQSSKENIMKSSKLKNRLSKHNLLTKHRWGQKSVRL